MSKFFLLLAASAFISFAQDIPLEWNPHYPVDIPYEVEIDRGKLSSLANIPAGTGFDVIASTRQSTQSSSQKPLPVVFLRGRTPNSIALRFSVPTGTTALVLRPNPQTPQLSDAADTDNLFQGIFAPESLNKWEHPQQITIESTEDRKLLFKVTSWNTYSTSYTVPVPENLHGPVRFELDVESLANMTWPCKIWTEQLDANGKKLLNEVVDFRWISHMRPPHKISQYRENGHIRPDAKAIRFRLEMRAVKSDIDNNGLPLANPDDTKPLLRLSHIALRPAAELPFPSYDNRFFAPGVSGAPDDFALNLNDDKVFLHTTTPMGSWSGGTQVKSVQELFFPPADGTLEAWFKPENWPNPQKQTTLFHTNNHLASYQGRYLPNRQTLHHIYYTPEKREIGILLKDAKDKIFKATALTDIPLNQWSHIAAQWSLAGGVQLYVNGKAVVNNSDFHYEGVDVAKEELPNSLIPMQLAVGNTISMGRGGGANSAFPNFAGSVDSLRISSCARYAQEFTPEKLFHLDDDTRALFEFNRSFDGLCGTGSRNIQGTVKASYGRVNHKLQVGSQTFQWLPETILPENDQNKVLSPLNYPVLPKPEDFTMARRTLQKTFSLAPRESMTIHCDEKPYMDFVEIGNHSDTPLVKPLLLNEGELDPRSFGDIAASLRLETLPEKERINRIFNFVLGASDYFMNHQAYFPAGSDTPSNVEYRALVMLNSYCGFECGPLNNLTANLFSCAGLCPASQTGGYGHSFEEVFYDGKNHLYDLSAQKFFPAFDNATAASLYDAELEPGILHRAQSSADHFIRLTTRGHYPNTPAFQPKVGITVNPGETFRIWFANNGQMNDLQCAMQVTEHKTVLKTNVSKETYADIKKDPIWKVDRYFPHVANAFLTFKGKPARTNPVFRNFTDNSFCYAVSTSYPIVFATYTAVDTDGKTVECDLSTDGGKSFHPITVLSVKARHEYLVRIKAPLERIARLDFTTEMMLNPRILTGILHQGANQFTLRAVSGSTADITIQYRSDVKPIVVKGVASYGTIPGHERQLAVLQPGETRSYDVTGASPQARAIPHGGLKARLADNKLTLTADNALQPSFASVTIDDQGAEHDIVVFIAKNARFALGQECAMSDHRARFTFEKIPAGNYSLWNLNRFPSHCAPNGGSRRQLHVHIPDSKDTCAVGSAINTVSDFYKAQYGKPGERSRWKWDFPLRTGLAYPYGRPGTVKLPATDSLEFSPVVQVTEGIDIAAILLVPEPMEETYNQMLKLLCGLNCQPWRVTAE